MEKLYKCLLEVLDEPTNLRVVVSTDIPALIAGDDTNIIYLIDRSEDDGETPTDLWLVRNNEDGEARFATNACLVGFFQRFADAGVKFNAHTESY